MKFGGMSSVKKVFIAFVVLMILAISALAIAPLFIDINKKIKPILVDALEKNLAAKVTMGDISLSLFGKVSLEIDTLKIIKDKITVDLTDLSLVMPYSVLRKNPTEWAKKIKIAILADEISVNNRQLVINKFKSDFLKEESIVKLKNTEFNIFEGKGASFLEMDFSQSLKAIFEFEVKNGVWPVEKIKGELEKKTASIPQAKKMIEDIDIDEKFETLKGKILLQNGITNIQELFMDIPESKVEVRASGIINTKNALKIDGNFILPLDNVPGELRSSDGRGKIPFDVIGTIDNPKINWEKMIELVVHAYTKDEGKKIIKKEVNKLKEKLMKDEKIKELIKGIKF
ncbi:MAG: hypothetical protein V4596_04365 [Bdellovibrionota bacterium]